MEEQQQQAATDASTPPEVDYDPTDDGVDYEAAYADAPAVPDAPPEPQPPRRRGRPLTPRQVQQQKAVISHDMALDEYMHSYNWEQPGMQVKIERTSPSWWKNVQTKGHLETRSAPYTLEEVQERWGGGSYRVYVTGPKAPGEPGRSLGTKNFTIAGEPRGTLADPSATTHPASGPASGGSGDQLAPQAQSSLVGLLGKNQDKMMEMVERGRSGSGEVDPGMFSEMRETIVGSAQAQVEAIQRAADRESQSLREQLNGLREETSRLRAETEARKTEMERGMESSHRESSSLLGTLIPLMSNQAHERAAAAIHDAGERVRLIQEQYARDIQSAELRYGQQVDNLKTLYAAQDMNQRTVYEGRIHQLEGEITLLRARCEHLDQDNRMLQGRVTETLIAQAQKQDIGVQLKQFSMLKEVAGSVFGGGNEGGGEDGLSEDAPDYLRLINRFAPALNAAAGAIAQKFASQQPGQQPMMPQQQMMPPQAMPQQMAMVPHPQAQAQAQATAPRPQKPKPAPDAVLKRSDLETGVLLLNSAMQSQTPPETAADAAAQTMPRDVLRALARRKPERVYETLLAAGLLRDELASPAGAEYLAAFLVALRTRLSGPAKAGTPQQQEG
jgi:hypothetical protein